MTEGIELQPLNEGKSDAVHGFVLCEAPQRYRWEVWCGDDQQMGRGVELSWLAATVMVANLMIWYARQRSAKGGNNG